MGWNEMKYKRIEKNGMELNVFKQGKWMEKNEVILIECFKIMEWKGMKINENEWNVSYYISK